MSNKKLDIIISAIDKATAPIKKLGGNIEGFAKKNNANFKKMAGFGTAGFAAIVGGATAAAASMGKTADRLLDLNAITGISTDSLQEYTAVARAAGVNSEALTNAAAGLTKRFKNMDDETSGVSKAMDILGVSVKDSNGDFKNMDTILMQSIDGLANMENELERNALANELFGKSYEDLIPIMALGFEGIHDIRKGAHEMGEVMSKEALDAANEFRIAQEQLTASLGAAKNAIASAVIPILLQLVETVQPIITNIIQWTKENEELTKKIIIGIGAFTGLIAILGTLGLVLGPIITTIKVVIVTVKALGVALAFLAANPIGLVIVAIAALVAAVVWLIKNWDTIGPKVEEVGRVILSVWGNVKDKMMEIWTALWDGVQNIMQMAVDWLFDKFEGLKNFIEGIIGFATGAFDRVQKIGESAQRAARNIGAGISGAASGVKNAVTGARELGGPVSANKTYLVGERGPELFTPATSGRVNNKAGGAGNITINMGGVTIKNEADENRLIEKMKRALTNDLQMSKFGIS